MASDGFQTPVGQSTQPVDHSPSSNHGNLVVQTNPPSINLDDVWSGPPRTPNRPTRPRNLNPRRKEKPRTRRVIGPVPVMPELPPSVNSGGITTPPPLRRKRLPPPLLFKDGKRPRDDDL